MRNHSPCYKCLRRSQICHAQCEDYFEWVAELQNENKNARRDAEAMAYAKENREKWERRRNLR